jgi:nitroreductase
MAETTLFRSRRSCRDFTDDPVPRELLVELLEAARWAPSGGNLQPLRLVVVQDRDRRRQLVGACLGQGFVASAPVVIVLCALPEVSALHYGARGRDLYCLQDVAAATQNLLLRATELGLGVCWVGAFDEVAVARVLGLDPSWRPLVVVPVGWPRERPAEGSRIPLDRLVVWLEDDRTEPG